MRLSRYFLPTLKETPEAAQIVSHQLMLRAGLIHQVTAGIYSWLPLGIKILKKISDIVREEQEKVGALEILMPTIQPAELWKESGRYSDYGKEMLRFEDRHGREMLYGPTAEEVVTDIFRNHVKSYRQLPLLVYNIQWKFRDEIRPRFGVMRGREFVMKDGYSFDVDQKSAKKTYEVVFTSYLNAFQRLGLRALPLKADTGPIGGDLSHEFHVLADTGESALYYDHAFDTLSAPYTMEQINTYYAATEEKHDPQICTLSEDQLQVARGIEVGHIFYFGTKYSEPFKALITNAQGQQIPVHMGSYGIGLSRLLGAIIEVFHDEKGIIWPESVSPFDFGLLNLAPSNTACLSAAETFYAKMQEHAIDGLYDDRSETPGVKFADMNLIGLPYHVIIGPQSFEHGQVEIRKRATNDLVKVSLEKAQECVISGSLSTLF